MPVPLQTPVIQYTASGATPTFVYPFLVPTAASLQVFVGGVLQGSGYSVSGVGNPAGGSVTFTSTPVAGTIVRLRRQVPKSRSTDYTEGGALRAETLDADIDYVVMMAQDTAALPSDLDTRLTAIEAGIQVVGGNVGMGTGTPASKLDVVGTITTTNLTAAGNGSFGGTLDVTGASTFTDAATFNVLNAASLMLGASASVGTNLTVAGTSTLTGAVSMGSTLGVTGATTLSTLTTSGAVGVKTTPSVSFEVGGTDAIRIPQGTTAQRPAGAIGQIRYNSDNSKFEGYGVAGWADIGSGSGAGATGGGVDQIFFQNDLAVTTNYTITTNKNAMTAGPISVNSGVVIGIPNGSTWTVV